jgi:hypothetical protein
VNDVTKSGDVVKMRSLVYCVRLRAFAVLKRIAVETVQL